MARTAKTPIGLFDIPVEFACPHCGDGIKVELGRLQRGAVDIACRSCGRNVHLADEETSRILRHHGEKLEALRRSISTR